MKYIVTVLVLGLVSGSMSYSIGLIGGNFCNHNGECNGTEVCSSFRCCEPVGGKCSSDADCCNGNCYGTTCKQCMPLSGNSCTIDDNCGYGKACINGRCCSGFNVPCRTSAECCNGMKCMVAGLTTTVCI